MPFVLDREVKWDGQRYHVSLHDLVSLIPHLKEGDVLTFGIIGIRNEQNRPIKRLKPLKRNFTIISSYYDENYKKSFPSLCFTPSQAQELNIGKDYHVTLLIIEHNYKPLFPFEWKYAGYYAKETIENLDRLEPTLISITQPQLQEAINYVLEARSAHSHGRIEDARTNLRKSLEALIELRKKIKVTPGKETKDFGRLFENLIKSMKGFVDYGGPHLGPAPRHTTDMIFNITVELVKMLARNIEEGTLIISG
jgi:hypothetical protein